jgi:hypothetical protein
LFQEFLETELHLDDIKKINRIWNTSYNGTIVPSINKIPIFLRHSKYIKNHRDFMLNPVQLDGIRFGALYNSSILALDTGYGKAENIENQIFTPTGTKRMGDIRVGDEVIGSNGNPTKVLGVFPQGKVEMYRVYFKDNSSVEVCGEHLWHIQSRNHKSRNKGFYIRTTKEIISEGLIDPQGGHKWSIPMTNPVEFKPQNVWIEPYLLGALLGDGGISTTNSLTITSADDEILESVKSSIPPTLRVEKKKHGKFDYSISRKVIDNHPGDKNNPLIIYLRNYGLMGTKSHTKFIPVEYKFNSVEVRTKILQGLLDTDGSTSGHNIEYTTTSKQLSDDVTFLVQSLGGTAKTTPRHTHYTHKGERKQGKLSYRIAISLPPDIEPFALGRKKAAYIPKTKYQPARYISKIEYVGKKEGQCIRVDAEDHLYLTENFIVTHNTLASLGFMSHLFETGQSANILTMVPKALYDNKKWKEEAVGLTDDNGTHIIDVADGQYKVGAFPMYNLIEVGNLTENFVLESGLKIYSDDERDRIGYYTQIVKNLKDDKYKPTSFGVPPRHWKRILGDVEKKDSDLYWKFSDKPTEDLIDIITDTLAKYKGKPNPAFYLELTKKLVVSKLNTYFIKTFGKAAPDERDMTTMKVEDFHQAAKVMSNFLYEEIGAFEKKAKKFAFEKYWEKKHGKDKYKQSDLAHKKEKEDFYEAFGQSDISTDSTAEAVKVEAEKKAKTLKEETFVGKMPDFYKSSLIGLGVLEDDIKVAPVPPSPAGRTYKEVEWMYFSANLAKIEAIKAHLRKEKSGVHTLSVIASFDALGAPTNKFIKKFSIAALSSRSDERRISFHQGLNIIHPKIAELYCQHELEAIYQYSQELVGKMRGYAIYQYGEFTFKKVKNNIILATNVAIQNIGFEKGQIENITEVVKEVMFYQNEREEKSIIERIMEREKGTSGGSVSYRGDDDDDIVILRAVIGKKYRMKRLPGEEKFIGKVTAIDKAKGEYEITTIDLEGGADSSSSELIKNIQLLGVVTDKDIERIKDEIERKKEEAAYEVSVIGEGSEEMISRKSKPFETSAKKTLQKQLDEMIEKINSLITEDAENPKFMLSQLGVDGFILDEAHQGKKIFTSVKTDASIWIKNPKDRKMIRIPTSNYDIHGGAAPSRAIRIFAICSYIHAIKTPTGEDANAPIMLLSATPFTNQPTEVFSMLSLVGMKVLKYEGIHNIKNFFDLFLKETLKYDFDHKGNFVKKIVVEDFRNKDKLNHLIWSLVNIRRGGEQAHDKPKKFLIPQFDKLNYDETEAGKKAGKSFGGIEELKELERITTTVIRRTEADTSSILDMNKVQLGMQEDLERYLVDPTITFDMICPNFKLYNELAKDYDEEGNEVETDDDDKEVVIVPDEVVKEMAKAVEEVDVKEKLDRSSESIRKFVKAVKAKGDYGRVFRALGASKAICLSPYLFRCNTLPRPTPENLIKYSPKLEYLVKCLKSVRDTHIANGTSVSGQLVYLNVMRFKYLDADTKKEDEYNITTLVSQYLIKKGWFGETEVAIITGGNKGKIGTKDASREEIIKRYNNGEIKVLFGSPAIREGVDLQYKSSVLYILTPDWNPTDMRQVEGRVWRQGNENAVVRIVYVLMDNSVEIFIYAKLEEKAKRLEKLMKEANVIIETDEMSVNPDMIKVALASEPTKRADIIVKKAEMTIADELARILRDEEATNKISAQVSAVEEKITEATEVYERYTAVKADVTKRYIEFHQERLARKKVEWKMNPEPLLSQFTHNKPENLYYTDDALRKNLAEKVANQSEAFEATASSFLSEIVAVAEVAFKTRNGSSIFIAKGHYVEDFDFDQICIMYVLLDFLYYRTNILLTPSQVKEDEKFSPDMKGADFINRAVELYGKKRKKYIDAFIAEEAMRQQDRFYQEPYEAEDMDAFERLPLVEKAKKVNGMVKDMLRYRQTYTELTPDQKKELTEGTSKRPFMAEIFGKLRHLFSDEFRKDVLNPVSEFNDDYDLIDRTYLRDRGMTLEQVPKLAAELSNKRYEFDQALKMLAAKKTELIARFTKERKERPTFSVDRIVEAFNETNKYLDKKFVKKVKKEKNAEVEVAT